MTFRKFETFIIIAIIAIIGIIYAFTQGVISNKTNKSDFVTWVQEPDEQQRNTTVATQSPYISYQGVEGKTALELLKSTHQVQSKEYTGIGEFVEAIDGQAPSQDEFWSFYVNGSQAQVGASAYITKSTDIIEWKLEKVGDFK